MLGREIFDSQTQFLGDWRRSGGTKNRNKDLLSRRWFARQGIRKIRKTNDSRCGIAFYCVEYCDHPKSAFPGTTGNHWCQRGNTVTQLQEKNMTVAPRRVYSFSVAGLETGKKYTIPWLRGWGAWEHGWLRDYKKYRAFGFSCGSPAPVSSLHTWVKVICCWTSRLPEESFMLSRGRASDACLYLGTMCKNKTK